MTGFKSSEKKTDCHVKTQICPWYDPGRAWYYSTMSYFSSVPMRLSTSFLRKNSWSKLPGLFFLSHVLDIMLVFLYRNFGFQRPGKRPVDPIITEGMAMNKPLQGHTVSSYDKEFKEITQAIRAMGDVIEGVLDLMEKSLETPDTALFKQARTLGDKLGVLNQRVEELSITVLALRQPLAVDLRFTVSTLKIATMLERMGDLAQNSVRRATELKISIPENCKKDIREMVNQIRKMVRNVVKGFGKIDTARADKVWNKEEKVDKLAHKLFNTAKANMKDDPKNIDMHANIVLVMKNLERIGDYATNVAKVVHYVSSGEMLMEEALNAS